MRSNDRDAQTEAAGPVGGMFNWTAVCFYLYLLLLIFTTESHFFSASLHIKVVFCTFYCIIGCRINWNIWSEPRCIQPATLYIVDVQVFPTEVFHLCARDGHDRYQWSDASMQLCLRSYHGQHGGRRSFRSVINLVGVFHSSGSDPGCWRLGRWQIQPRLITLLRLWLIFI